MRIKYGFTLSEVLITLVVIGVIAAITVPIIIARYRENQIDVQFRKAYSTLTNAFNKVNMEEFGGNVQCYYYNGTHYNSECIKFFSTLTTKEFSILKTCRNSAKSNNCIPDYQYQVPNNCGGYSNIETNNAYVFSNGQMIMIGYGSNNWPLFLVDVNGFKGPNKGGYDLFSFIIKKEPYSSIQLNSGGCELTVPGGRSTKNMILHAMANLD